MLRLLLDTQVLLWALTGNARIAETALAGLHELPATFIWQNKRTRAISTKSVIQYPLRLRVFAPLR